MRRMVLQRLRKQEWQWLQEEIRHLFELWKQIPERRIGQAGARSPLEQLRHLLIRLSEHWDSYRVFDWQPEVPWINNGTAQVIGRMKMRSRTVRGYKSWHGMQAALMLTGSELDW
jgi:hypothetical protein